MVIKKQEVSDEEVDVVSLLKERAEKHLVAHLRGGRRPGDTNERVRIDGSMEENRPYDLWTAKLLLEIATLYKGLGE